MDVFALRLPSSGAHAGRLRDDTSDERRRSTTWLSTRAVLVAICGVVMLAPFETTAPVVRLPGQSVTDVELGILALLVLWAIVVLRRREARPWDAVLLPPLALFAAVAVLTALVAPAHVANALHMAARTALTTLLFIATATTVRSADDARRVIVALGCSGAVVAVLVMLEYFGVTTMAPFHDSTALIGTEIRASGPLQYPTLASMFLEICFAATSGVLLATTRERRWASMVLAMAALSLMFEAIVLTFTRSGLITAALTIVIAVVAGGRRRPFVDVAPLLIMAVLMGASVVASRSAEVLRARLTTEGQGHWFRATFSVPGSLALRPNERTRVPIRVRNDGQITWNPSGEHPFRLAYHWLAASADEVFDWEGERTEFAAPVSPGSTVSLDAVVMAPDVPGRYRLLWDIEQHDRLWFSTEPEVRLAISRATVAGARVDAPVKARRSMRMPRLAVRPDRRELWAAAFTLWRERPLLGIGLDNYRLLRAGASDTVDRRIHSNNMYLELVVGTGLLGAAVLSWLGVRIVGLLRVLLALGTGEAIGLVAAIAAILIHGLSDTFLGFTPLYVLIGITCGVAVALGRSAASDAHRI